MFSNQILSHTISMGRQALLVAGLAGALGLSGCSVFSRGDGGASNTRASAPSGVASSSSQPTEEVQVTVTEALGDLPPEGISTVIEDNSGKFNASAPRSYVVKRGDTLWGLAQMFLRDPFLWPEIWFVNPQVQNPHLIYPGDTLTLAQGSNGNAQLQLSRGPLAKLQPMLRSKSLGDNGPIGTIPYEAIRAFLSRPGLISKSEIKRAPYVLSIREGHLIAGTDHDVYIRKLEAVRGERFNVVHIGEPLRDPDGGGSLGNMAIYAGTVQVSRAGDPATANVTESGREILSGDVLVPESQADTRNIVPHAPTKDIDGHVIGLVDSVLLVGQYQVVAINRGTNHGVEIGHVLRVREADHRARDRCARVNGKNSCFRWRDTPLPGETAGTLLIFKTLERMSYGLVVAESSPIHLNDRIGNP